MRFRLSDFSRVQSSHTNYFGEILRNGRSIGLLAKNHDTVKGAAHLTCPGTASGAQVEGDALLYSGDNHTGLSYPNYIVLILTKTALFTRMNSSVQIGISYIALGIV
jgi:hypothetical protein